MKQMLDLGAVTSFGLFEGQHQRFLSAVFHFLNRAASDSSTAPSLRILRIFTQIFRHAEIPRVADYLFVILSDQIPSHGDIGDIRRCGGHTVGQPGQGIDVEPSG